MRRLTHDGGRGQPYRVPSLSRDGRQLAYARGTSLYRARGDATAARRVDDVHPVSLELSPSGTQLAYLRTIPEPAVCVPPQLPGTCGAVDVTLLVRRRGARAASIARREAFTFGFAGEDLLATLAPDPGAGSDGQRICRVSPANECTEVLAADGLRDLYSPEGSPDGRFVVAVASPLAVDEPDAAFAGHVALFRAAGGAFVRDLSFGPDANPTWSPDGRHVAFERGGAIHVVDVVRGVTRRLVRGTHPAWGRR